MKLVQRVGVEGLRAIASVYKCYFDIIGDPVEDTGSRRIVFVPSEQYRSDRVSPPGICFVYGPCGKCGKYFSNYQRHLDDELGLSDLFDDAFSDDDDQVDPDADLLDVELLDPDQMQEVLDDVGEHFVNDVMTDLWYGDLRYNRLASSFPMKNIMMQIFFQNFSIECCKNDLHKQRIKNNQQKIMEKYKFNDEVLLENGERCEEKE